jgi:hypothetical protein
MKMWTTVNKISGKGCWLVDPDGNQVLAVSDYVLARNLSAAMSLTTQEQRTAFLLEHSGYGKPARKRSE